MSVKLYHRANEVAMDFSGLDSIGAIDIYYSGKMYAESMLPNDWQVFETTGRILCLSFGNSFPELLFEYSGLINIVGGKVVDKDLKSHPIVIIVSDFDYWENITGEFDSDTTRWDDYSQVHTRQSGLLRTSIVRNGLTTKPDEFYYSDGSSYYGGYHQHGDGQAMTGLEHTDESIEIYRKDNNGEIFNPRKKRTKRQITKLIKQKVTPIITRTRASTSGHQGGKYGTDPTTGEGTGSTAGGSGGGGGSGGY